MADIIQIRRDTASNWSTANPILAQGELGFETDTLKIKIGDGSSNWSSLGYAVSSLDGANTWTGPQRTTLDTSQDNSIDFTRQNDFELTATSGIISVQTAAGCSGQSGVIIIHSATNITGWSSEFNFPGGTAPDISNSDEVFAYYIENPNDIWIGLVK